MSIIRQATYQLLAEEFSKHSNISDPFWRLRGSLDNPELLHVLVLLDKSQYSSDEPGHLEKLLREIDEVVRKKPRVKSNFRY